jgi:hypothetical protein
MEWLRDSEFYIARLSVRLKSELGPARGKFCKLEKRRS